MHDTSFTVHIKDEIPTYIFFIDTSGSVGKIDFEIVVLCLKKIITELPDKVKIEIIALSSDAIIVFKKRGATNLVEALKLGEVTITNFCMNQKNYFVLLTDGVPTDDPEPIIQKLILKVISIIYINKK
ncbi:hypothetical protein ACTFIT_009921 [Dictyostelium discoideum]